MYLNTKKLNSMYIIIIRIYLDYNKHLLNEQQNIINQKVAIQSQKA